MTTSRARIKQALHTLPAAHQAQRQLQEARKLQQQGELARAAALCRQLVDAQPDHVDALHLAGILAYQNRQPLRAIQWLRRAIQTNAADASVHATLGQVLQSMRRHSEALPHYQQALALEPKQIDLRVAVARLLLALGRNEDALASYQQALRLAPDQPDLLNDVGIALMQLDRHEQALRHFERVLQAHPDHAVAHYNRGNALRSLGRHQQAVASYDRVLSLLPATAGVRHEVFNNRGNALRAMNRLDEASHSYQQARQWQADYADAHWNDALCRLLAGDFTAGWPLYEWRWASEFKHQRRDFAQALWLGQASLAGKTILLHAEQGLGDTLQFYRYASLVYALGARVILEVQPSLVGLLHSLAGVTSVVTRGEALPHLDYHCPLLSLPLALRTRADSIPAYTPYIVAPPALVARYRNQLPVHTSDGAEQHKLRVGLVWRGNPAHTNDRQRSMALAQLQPLLAVDAEFHLLQQDLHAEDRELLAQWPGQATYIQHDFSGSNADFRDTAACVALLDVVITVDTSVAHLAGAMGKPVWIMLPHHPDWRWQLQRQDNPWYPSAHLFRQPVAGDWTSVVDDVAHSLRQLAASKCVAV